MQFLYSAACVCAASTLLLTLGNTSPVPNPKHPKKNQWPPKPPTSTTEQAAAVYFMNNLAANSVFAVSVAADGTLDSIGSTTLTGGCGGNQVDPKTGLPNGPDALASQGSVQVSGNALFALNAASNTLSMLRINPSDPTELTLLGQPTWTGGDFPVTVAVSSSLGLACVGNGGASAGVSCAPFDEWNGLGAFDTIRPFKFGQTNPPTGPLNDISQVFFTDDESALIVMVKGNGSAANPGFIATFPVDAAAKQVSAESTQAVPAEARVLFGTATIPGTNNVLASDAAFGAFILNLDDPADPIAITNVTNQKATCWSVVSSVTGTGFVDDVIVSQLVEIDLTNGAIVSVADPQNQGQGMIDFRAAGNNIYALSPGNGTLPAAVTVFDISGGRGTAKAIQNFVVQAADKNAEGLAVYVPAAH